jgi:hypothetical protein
MKEGADRTSRTKRGLRAADAFFGRTEPRAGRAMFARRRHPQYLHRKQLLKKSIVRMIGRRDILSVAHSTAGVARARRAVPGLAVALALATVFLAGVGAQTNSATNSKAPTVRIGEADVDNEHGVTSTDCVLVLPDGRFHLERRRQVLPSSTATLVIFESSLDSSQLEQLQGIVENERMSRLPEYDKQPVFFRNAPWFSSVTVDIETGEAVRRVGYWLWHERSAGPAAPADVKKRWQDSEAALRPLVEWFHGIEALKLSPSDTRPSGCSSDQR